MAKYFERPEGALTREQFDKLMVGTPLYEVYGIFPPEASKTPKYLIHHQSRGDRADDNFETYNVKYDFVSENSRTDRNIGKNGTNGYNDNYLFLTLEDAEAAVEEFKRLYKETPDLVQKEHKRIQWIDEIFDYAYDDYYDMYEDQD